MSKEMDERRWACQEPRQQSNQSKAVEIRRTHRIQSRHCRSNALRQVPHVRNILQSALDRKARLALKGVVEDLAAVADEGGGGCERETSVREGKGGEGRDARRNSLTNSKRRSEPTPVRSASVIAIERQ